MIEKKTRMQEFEALRALSIILLMVLHSEILGGYVFGYHLGPSATYVAFFLLGSFFFLAGYFEDGSLKKYHDNIPSLIKSKFIRIYPPYWFALFLFVFVMGFSLKKLDLSVYLLNLQFIFSPVFVKQLLTLWYISIVVAYYIVFGFLMFHTKSNIQLLIWSVFVFFAAYLLHGMTKLLDPRFFQYYFIFLAGVYFSRFEQLRAKMFELTFLYKLGAAALGVLFFWLVQTSGYEVINPLYILVVDFFILSWVWMWLSIFRTRLGGWQIWSFISTASFFAYLYHRPFWEILSKLISVKFWGGRVLFNLIPGSIIVLIICYFLQRSYDLTLASFRRNK